MFKSKKKKLLQKAKAEALVAAMAKTTDTPVTSNTEHPIYSTDKNTTTTNSVMTTMPCKKKEEEQQQQQLKYSLLLDDFPQHDFRSSVILPQLNNRLTYQHYDNYTSPPLSPPPSTKSSDYQKSRSSDSSYESVDGTKHYRDLMAWRHQRNQNRYSNSLFGGKQRNRPKPRPLRTTTISVKRTTSVSSKQRRKRSTHMDEDQSSNPFDMEQEAEKQKEITQLFLQKQEHQKAQKQNGYIKDEGVEEEENALALSDTSIITPPASTTTEVRDNLAKASDFDDSEKESFSDDLDSEHNPDVEDYELDSDIEENYFFKDFSANEKQAKRQSKVAAVTQKRATKTISRFDLSSFAKDLHSNRLSVVQQQQMRESRVSITEEDELELEKLMQSQNGRLSYIMLKNNNNENATGASLAKEISQLPPVPKLNKEYYNELISNKQQQQQQQMAENKNNTIVDHKINVQPETLLQGKEELEDEKEEEAYPVDGASDSNKIALDDDIEIPPTFKTNNILPKVSITALPTISTIDSSIKQSLKKTESAKSPTIAATPLDLPLSSLSVTTATTPLLPLASSESNIKKALKAPRKPFKKEDIRLIGLVEEDHYKENEHIQTAKPSLQNECSKSATASKQDDDVKKRKKEDGKKSKKEITASTGGIMSRGLFGSLRQVNRNQSKSVSSTSIPVISSPIAVSSQLQQSSSSTSSSSNTLKGLARTLSTSSVSNTTNHNSGSGQQQVINKLSNNGISRAAMAVIQHNVTKHELKQDNENEAVSVDASRRDMKRVINLKSLSNLQRAKSDTSGPPRLISQLIARTSSTRKAPPTKIINMDNGNTDDCLDSAAARKERAQVIRKTIIYVQPNSLHNLLKNGGEGSTIKLPTSSSPLSDLNPVQQQASLSPLCRQDTVASSGSSTISSDGQTQHQQSQQQQREYFTATKVSRQISVKKRIVDTSKEMDDNKPSLLSNNNDNHDHHSSPQQRHLNRWQVQSFSSDDETNSNDNSRPEKDNKANNTAKQLYMEGVEFREMSDGSVIWGLVKKQGNRKSFYAPKQQSLDSQQLEFEHLEDEELTDEISIAAATNSEQTLRQQSQHNTNNNGIPSLNNTSSINGTSQHINANVYSYTPPTSLSPPPPIPKRSPRRPPVHPKKDIATTNIYYSDQVTLPSLLSKMINRQDDISFSKRGIASSITNTTSSSSVSSNDNYPGDNYDDDMSYYGSKYTTDDDEHACAENDKKMYFMNSQTALSSVDDQLDEMMRILTNQQQNEHVVLY